MPLQTSPLYIYTPNTSQSVAKVLLGKTDENKKNFFGSLFGIFEIDLNDKNFYSVLEEISNEVENTYYNFNNIRPKQFQLEEHFEETVKSLNAKIHNILIRNHLEKETQKLHLLFGVVKQNKLIFTATHGIYAFLIFKTKTASYRIADIIGNAKRSDGREMSESYAYKMFTDILSGEFHFYDYLYFCNKNLFLHIPLDDVKYLITHSSLLDSTEEMRNHLWQASINTTFAGILLSNQPSIDTSKSRYKSSTTQGSLSHLLKTEHSTERLLSMSIAPALQRLNQKIFAVIRQSTPKMINLVSSLFSKGWAGTKKYVQRLSSSTRMNLQSYFTALHRSKAPFQWIYRWKKWITSMVPKNIFINAHRHIHRGTRFSFYAFKHTFNPLWQRFVKRFTWWQILSFVIILLFIIGFTMNLKEARRIREAEKKEAAYQIQVAEIQTALNNVQAFLIYKDIERAKSEIYDTFDQILKLPQDTQEQRDITSDLKKQAEGFLNTLRKASIMEHPQEFHRFDALKSMPLGVNRINQHLFIFSVAGNEPIMKLALLESKETPTLLSSRTPQGTDRIAYTVDDKNTTAIILLSDRSLTRINAKDIIDAPNMVWQEKEEDIIDISLYNNRLYTLSAKNQQIFKHLPTPSGFSSGEPWIVKAVKHESPFVSFTIDGFVYLVTENGDVYKFATGKQQTFELEAVDPPIRAASKIFTRPSSKFLYVLEPSQKRLILYEKSSGKLRRQYLFPSLTEIQDFVLDEKEEILFLLEKNVLYSVRLLPDA